jgi:hypothetical protein
VADDRLRELERRWQQTGLVDDEAAFLSAAVRAGELTQDRADLAAYARHPAALRAFGPTGRDPADLARWTEGLGRWGRVLCVRVATRALALAHDHVAYTQWPEAVGLVTEAAARDGLAALARWCAGAAVNQELAALAGAGLTGLPCARQLMGLGLTCAARAAIAEDGFGAHAANAIVRAEAIAGAGILRPPLLELVRREALGR